MIIYWWTFFSIIGYGVPGTDQSGGASCHRAEPSVPVVGGPCLQASVVVFHVNSHPGRRGAGSLAGELSQVSSATGCYAVIELLCMDVMEGLLQMDASVPRDLPRGLKLGARLSGAST